MPFFNISSISFLLLGNRITSLIIDLAGDTPPLCDIRKGLKQTATA
jgi:hypothetical protein